MSQRLSKGGSIVSGVYIMICVVLIATQGLFGESFITLILGLPWSMIPAFFEFGGIEGAGLYALALLPLVVNAAILYWIGSRFDRK